MDGVTYYVEVEGKQHLEGFATKESAHAWAAESQPGGTFYTVVDIGPSNVGSRKPELFKTADDD